MMFRLSKARQLEVDAAHVLYFPDEEVDPEVLVEWTPDLNEYLAVIPEVYHEAIQDQSLVRNKELFEQFIAWCKNTIEQVYADYEVPSEWEGQFAKLNESARVIFEGTLHDAVIEKVTRSGLNITLHVNGTRGFNAYSYVELTFENVSFEEGTLGYYYIYDELIWTGERYGFRVLSDNPYKEWTIAFEQARAKYVYDPAVKDEAESFETIADYVAALNPKLRYVVKVGHQLIDVNLIDFDFTVDGLFAKGHFIGNSVEAVAGGIYTYDYENPHAHFSEPVPLNDIYDFALSDDLELRVRAYNTLYEHGADFAEVANRILRDTVINEDNELILGVIAGHFAKLGYLDEDNKKKYEIQ